MQYDRQSVINSSPVIKKELQFLFKKDESLIIFDIGACEGESSIQYSRLFPKAKIYAFEPLPANIQLIRDNFKKYNIENATYLNKALSSQNGHAEFYVSSGQPENVLETDWDFGNKSSSLLAPEKDLEKFGFLHFDKKIQVETLTLKTFCNSNNIKSIDFIHMDVQGAELMVLEGAGDFIASVKAIWLEVSKLHFYKDQPLENDIRDFMASNNFILIKNELNGEQGDQLYVSKNFFPSYKLMLLAKFLFLKKVLENILIKLKRL
jgi:FkbM family methyltransferase